VSRRCTWQCKTHPRGPLLRRLAQRPLQSGSGPRGLNTDGHTRPASAHAPPLGVLRDHDERRGDPAAPPATPVPAAVHLAAHTDPSSSDSPEHPRRRNPSRSRLLRLTAEGEGEEGEGGGGGGIPGTPSPASCCFSHAGFVGAMPRPAMAPDPAAQLPLPVP